MLFNSLEFLLFFPLVTVLYFVFPTRFRWVLLLAASCYFYMAFVPIYIIILGTTIVIDYFAGIQIEKSEGKRRKSILLLSLVCNIGILFVFKYYNFINTNLSFLTDTFGVANSLPFLTILLPIGLSFHTFQAMSYTLEVYYGRQKAERHFGIYALYVMFYPQLVAGPIERPQNILHQLKEHHPFNYENVKAGLLLMAWGMFKKVVIADRLAMFVNTVYGDPTSFSSTSMLVATLFFSLQIYCDFSGYSDIAIGSAQVMGIKLMTNFNKPYGSRSVSEFWTRWHISLSSWFRDYVYIPLGGNRVVTWRRYYNLLIVFLLSGLWHGANWTFVVWGLLHAVFLISGLMTKSLQDRASSTLERRGLSYVNSFIHIAFTFLLVTFAWAFFRAANTTEAVFILKQAVSASIHFDGPALLDDLVRAGLGLNYFLLSIFLVVLLLVIHNLSINSVPEWIRGQTPVYRWTLYYMLLLSMILFGIYERSQFIYFQF